MIDPHCHEVESIQQSSEWLRVTLASIGDAVVTTDVNGDVTFLNPVAEALTGWTQEDAAGKPLDDVFRIVNEETRRTVENPATKALREGTTVGLANHTLLIARDGSERPIDDSAAPIRDEDGTVAGVVLVFRDVTERRRHEHQVQDALTYADSIIATMREPFVVLDKSLRIRSANASFYRHFRVSRQETEGRHLYELGNRQWDIPRLRLLLEEILTKSGPIHDFEVAHDFPAIGERVMLLNANRFEFSSGQPELILLAIEDITERRQAEAAVQASEIRYRRLFQAAKDGILMLEAKSLKIIDANPFMTELLGYSRDEFMGKELWEIGFFGDKAASQAAYEELRAESYVRYDHLPLQTRDGRRAEVEFVSNVYQSGDLSVAQCNIRDISERCRLERTMQAQAEELVDLHRRKDEFLAMLSHELRSPLAPLANAVHLLRLQETHDPLQQRARTIIERQVSQLTHLIDDLMEVSRIATGRVQLRQERINMSGVVERAVDTTRPLMEQRKHELSVLLPAEPIWLHADAARLEQVVVNLLSNAAKYTDEGGDIRLTVEQEAGDCVVRVQDTGVGIAPELLPRIFDLFTQAERSLDRSQGGLGIGLALVRRLVELHGGRVAAFSVLGRGSEIVVRIPTVESPAIPQLPLPSEAAPPSLRRVRVLVVDDNLDAADSLALLVSSRGHDVRTAHDGPETLKAVIDHRPEVVVLDIGLPGMDGYEVAKRIREQAGFEDVVLVAMTGYGQESDRRRALEAGFDHHLVKPADFGKLQQILATEAGKAGWDARGGAAC